MIAKPIVYAGKRLVGYLIACSLVAVIFLGMASAFSKAQRCTEISGRQFCVPQLTAWRIR